MDEVVIRRITGPGAQDANLPNEPFRLWGRMVPSLSDGAWSCRVERFPQESEMCFPDAEYDIAEDDTAFLGAYAAGRCVGVAVLRRGMFRYLYLDDLKVVHAMRGRGIGGQLVTACVEEARRLDMQGVYAVAQDNNASACLFYLKHGFQIGGFDNRGYRGTSQADKADLYFYRDV